MGTRDDMCGIDVGRMAELGGFAEEITIIGCAYKKDGEVLYRVTDAPDEAYAFYEGAAREGLVPTLPQIYVRREIIPAGQRERMTDEAKRTCARKMQSDFDAHYWQVLDAISAVRSENAALLEHLEAHKQALEGRYAREPLDIFGVFLNEALERRQLDRAHYEEFATWLSENYEKMADDWITKEHYECTFYGFASYRTPESLNMRIDTEPFNLLEKQQELRLNGQIATPIFQKTCQYRENSALPKVRRAFGDWLKTEIQRWALRFETCLETRSKAALPYSEEDVAACSEPAQKTLRYYEALWKLC